MKYPALTQLLRHLGEERGLDRAAIDRVVVRTTGRLDLEAEAADTRRRRWNLLHGGLDLKCEAWNPHDLIEGERVTGEVVRLPQPNAHHGTKLFLRRDDDVIAFSATADKGHTVLERQLRDVQIRVANRITVTFTGWRESRAGHRYRHYEVSVDGR